jgi:hypothetical protein
MAQIDRKNSDNGHTFLISHDNTMHCRQVPLVVEKAV